MKISTIVPIYNEEKILSSNFSFFKSLAQRVELIFVDGQSTDRSCEIAGQCAKVLCGQKGRAVQMNQGGYAARGNLLLFLHADSVISQETLISIEKVAGTNFIGGCLTQRIDKEAFIYRLIEAQGNFRAKFSKIFYGDQGIFVKKDAFFEVGGFPQAPIMEDVLFTRDLRKIGETIVLPDKVFVSARRWEKKGVVRTTLLYNLIILLFKLGVPLKRIKLIYGDLR